MNIGITTNIDRYKNKFDQLKIVPRVGEFVLIKSNFREDFINKKYPCRLEVKSITHDPDYSYVSVELHYNSTDFEIMKVNKIEPYK
jgi:hypothetical protein